MIGLLKKTVSFVLIMITFSICCGQETAKPNNYLPSEKYERLWKAPELNKLIDSNIEKYRKTDAVISIINKDGKPVNNASVSVKQLTHEFLFGSNLFVLGQLKTPEDNKKYEEAFKKIFNFASVPFYWQAIEPEQGVLRYEDDATTVIWRRPPPDRLVEWCLKNNITPKGHPLLWHEHNPKWLPQDKNELEKLYVKRFNEIAKKYSKTIPVWDCVNEPTICTKHYPLYSEDRAYIKWAFDLAKGLFPTSTVMLINETPDACYEYSGLEGKDTRYYKIIDSLINRGTDIDAIGFQFHIMSEYGINGVLGATMFTPEQILKVHSLYEKYDLPQYITEITIPTLGDDKTLAERTQAEVVENYYRLWFSLPKMAGITWWNLGDGTAISHEDKWNGGLLDSNLDPKPSYMALDKLINKIWRTNIDIATDKNGSIKFRGFKGRYSVKVKTDQGEKEFEITLKSEHGDYTLNLADVK